MSIDIRGLYSEFKNQHGNAKNGDVKRFSKFCNTTLVKERWFILIVLASLYGYQVVSKEKRSNEQHKNEERRKEELHQAQLKRLEKED